MAGFSDAWELNLLNHLFGKATITAPPIWVTLATAAISDDDTGSTISEPSGDFARVSTGSWTSAAAGVVSNAAIISFAPASSNWGSVTYFALADASTAGNIICFGSVNTAKSVASGDEVYFAIGAFDVKLS